MGDSNPRRSVRCPHCAGPLAKEMETSDWTLPPLIRDSFSMIGSAVGCTTSAFYGFNHGSTCDSLLFSLCRVDRNGNGPGRGRGSHSPSLIPEGEKLPVPALAAAPAPAPAPAPDPRRGTHHSPRPRPRPCPLTGIGWCCSSTCPTCFFILSFSILASVIAISNLTG
ncbi:hypothetical protein HYC85_022446 [Camellia sinensis]|uniref:Uncharacterized protein n=1 Tax=Camellia sinensis TaxID=4442 RepID=A0A7J7GKF2_CAMSI|nr:hypothetical protein HYC85_022446 [Camellia sinensis]